MTAPPLHRPLDATGIILPAAFRAFRALQEPAYRAYTDAHASPGDTGLILGLAFGELAAHWSVIMLRPDPAAYAWDLFAATVRHRVSRLRISAASPLQYEVVVLHHLAGCGIDRTSETTGRSRDKIRHLLRTWHPGAVAPLPEAGTSADPA
ncbi:MAG TPA: hypothetical protein VN520_28615 [Streptomyces sp.]|uniref:hypothetical protein n=1 Tax=Streptomyces sp. TaxID=1931 RepID=UPI002D00CA3A|nr:hypothetical protein [Streptomyces sp.]HWU10288.1 hypothetical protein [Streptomyces sp.]